MIALLVVSGVGCGSAQPEPTPSVVESRLTTEQFEDFEELETNDGMADVLPAAVVVLGVDVDALAEGVASPASAGDGAGADADGGMAAEAAVGVVRATAGTALTSEEVDALYAHVGVPWAWRADLKAIAHCESRWRFDAVGDNGNSLGLHQLWHGWAWAGEDLMVAETNTWVAVRVREIRGRFGGKGGWSCADLLGIP